jgi:hypothetical protein
VPGFYASVGAAVSSDDGASWTKLGPVLTSSLDKDWPSSGEPRSYDQGVCGPGAVVDRNGRYLLLYYTDNSRLDGRSVQISVARADLRQGPPVPEAFKKYYWGKFSEPGLRGRESPIPARKAYQLNPVRSYGHPVWSEFLERYVMVLNVAWWDPLLDDLSRDKSGIFVAFSEDGIYWSEPRPLVQDYCYFVNGRSFSYMGSILFDDATGKSGWLVYGHSDAWGDPTHFLVGQRIAFEL